MTLSQSDVGQNFLLSFLPSIVMLGAFYLMVFFMVNAFDNPQEKTTLNGVTLGLFICEVVGGLMPENLALVLALVEFGALFIIPYYLFKLSGIKSFLVLIVSILAPFLLGAFI